MPPQQHHLQQRGQSSVHQHKDFYLNNPLPTPEFIRFQADLIPKDIWEQYNLDGFNDNGWIYTRVDKGMYGLPQADRVALDHLLPILQAAGYKEAGRIPGLFRHTHNDIVFTLVVDDFLIQHTTEEALTHLIHTLDYRLIIPLP